VRPWTQGIDLPYSCLLSCLYNDIVDDVVDVGGLLLDRSTVGSDGSVRLSNPELAHEGFSGNRRRSAGLPRLTCQKPQILIDLGLGRAVWLRRAGVPIRYRDGEPRAPDGDGAAGVGDRNPAKMVDDARSIRSMRYGRGPTTNSNGCNWSTDGCRSLVAELSTNKTKDAFGERSRHLATVGSWVIDKIIDHKVAVRTDIKGGFVNEQKLNCPFGGRVNSLVMHDPRADL
jgi:hypothetical protein